MREILLLLGGAEEQKAFLQEAPRDLTLRSCGSLGQLRECINPNLDGLICDLGLGLSDEPEILEGIHSYGVKLILCGRLTHASVVELTSLSTKLIDVRIFLRRRTRHGEVHQIIGLLDEPDGGPTGMVVNQLQMSMSSDLLRFAIPALVLGRQKKGVNTFAEIFGVSPRSLQMSLRSFGLPSPHKMLAWGQACWINWRMEHYGLNSKQAAAAGGFRTTSEMAAMLASLFGKSPRTRVRECSIADLTRIIAPARDNS